VEKCLKYIFSETGNLIEHTLYINYSWNNKIDIQVSHIGSGEPLVYLYFCNYIRKGYSCGHIQFNFTSQTDR
jgi:hypothetical protein